VSKYLALLLFIILPFLGAFVGYQFAPTKVVEVPVLLPNIEDSKDNMLTATTAVASGMYSMLHTRDNSTRDWAPTYLYTNEEPLTAFALAAGYSGETAVLVNQSLYYYVLEQGDIADSSTTTIYTFDLVSGIVEEVAAVPGLVGGIAAANDGVVVAVPADRICLDKATDCKSLVYQVATDGVVTELATVSGVKIQAYQPEQGLVMTGGYGDAGCLSGEVYVYDEMFLLQSTYRGAGCIEEVSSGQTSMATFTAERDTFRSNAVRALGLQFEPKACYAFSWDETTLTPVCDGEKPRSGFYPVEFKATIPLAA
jgi:hypothetical protein